MAKKVQVTFIDHSNGKIFGMTELTSEGLPPSFAGETVLQIDDAEWTVVEADPVESEAFIASGLLALRLEKK